MKPLFIFDTELLRKPVYAYMSGFSMAGGGYALSNDRGICRRDAVNR